MSLESIRQAITTEYPALDSDAYWLEIDAALVIAFTERNTGDLHKSVRERRGLKPGSHKTHIDVTSGKDIPAGLSPVKDFFSLTPGTRSVALDARVFTPSVVELGGTRTQRATDWESAQIRVTPLFPRNATANPSMQLLQYDDLQALRERLDVGWSLILLRRQDGVLDALGIRTTPALKELLGKKTKRMFIPDQSAATEVTSSPEEDVTAESHTPTDQPLDSSRGRGRRQGRILDPRVRRAIEARGMDAVREIAARYDCSVVDVETPERALAAGFAPWPGFDQAIYGDHLPGGALYVEVKSTVTSGRSVRLSFNEFQAALHFQELALAVVSDIELNSDGGDPAASGGTVRFYRWCLDDALYSFKQELQAACEPTNESRPSLVASSVALEAATDSTYLELLTEGDLPKMSDH